MLFSSQTYKTLYRDHILQSDEVSDYIRKNDAGSQNDVSFCSGSRDTTNSRFDINLTRPISRCAPNFQTQVFLALQKQYVISSLIANPIAKYG